MAQAASRGRTKTLQGMLCSGRCQEGRLARSVGFPTEGGAERSAVGRIDERGMVSPLEETMIRIVAISLMLVFSAGAASAQAANEAFCAQMKGEPGKPPNCAYKTMAQCQEAVKADQGTCIENPKKGKM
jgi:hypothetical protein